MSLKSLDQFCQNKGLEIAQVLFEEYDSANFEVSGRKIEGEIYDIATSYSKILFFEANEFLQESVRDEVRTLLASRFDNKQVWEMKDIDMIAHWIKSEVIKVLEGRGIFV